MRLALKVGSWCEMTEGELQLHRDYRQLQEKRLYFLLAGAGTSIGFATTQIGSTDVDGSFLVLVASLTLLGMSFLSGIRLLIVEEQFIYTNASELKAARDPVIGMAKPGALREFVEKETYEPLGKKKRFWGRSQVYCLFLGGILLPVWKILSCGQCAETIFKFLPDLHGIGT